MNNSLKIKSYEDLNKESKLVIDDMNRSINNKRSVSREAEAIVQLFMTMVNMSPGNMAYSPGLGFDLHNLLYRGEGSMSFAKYERELKDRLISIANNSSIEVDISQKDKDINILITYIDKNGYLEHIPFVLDANEEELKLKYDKIYVKP